MFNEIPHNEEIRSETHVDNDFGFECQPLNNFLRHFFTPTELCSFGGEVFQILFIVSETFRHRKVGKVHLVEIDIDIGTLCDP